MESKSKALTLKKATFPYIDDAVYSWFTFARSKSFPVDQDLLSTKAIEFKEKFLQKLKDSDEIKRLEGLKASSGWIKNFKKHFQIHSR